MQLRIVFIGLSITSSWGNGHATTYRGLVRELVQRGHDVLFLERDLPFYAAQRDLPHPPYGRTELYENFDDLRARFTRDIQTADAVIVGSYAPEGILIGDFVFEAATGLRVFYDIDTPITVRSLQSGGAEYIEPRQVQSYDLYATFTAGPMLDLLVSQFGARAVRVLYCSADLEHYYPEHRQASWDLGYLGTYSPDRAPALEQLLLEPSRRARNLRFVVAGSQYPADQAWPDNVERIDHVPPPAHRAFYNAQRFTLNLTRREMMLSGYSPSIRLFEAAACGTPIISDPWPGLEQFFTPGKEILTATSAVDVVRHLTALPEDERTSIGLRALERVRREHTAAHRAEALESYLLELLGARARNKAVAPRPAPVLELRGAS